MKVLVISHLPFSTQNNMGKTLRSLFSEFDKAQICQLYIYPSYPNVECCASHYRVTDKEMLRSAFLRKKAGGEVAKDCVHSGQGLYENPEDESLYRNRKNKSALRRLLRDALWCVGKWYTPELERWLDREAPDRIFVAPGVAKFLYDIAMTISRKRNIPIVTYICDEYYFVKSPRFGLEWLRLRLLQSKIRKLIRGSEHLVVISEELREAYGKAFGIPISVLMTGASQSVAQCAKRVSAPTQISYFGNIRCNRYISLGEIGAVLDQINGEKGTNYCLKIYSPEKNREILSHLEQYQSIELCGFVSGKAFQEAFEQAQLLLHTEAFDEASVDIVKHSISTKIADSLASGIPLVAYAPRSISSMQHLMRNQCALTATDTSMLKEVLLKAFEPGDGLRKITASALATAERFHDREKVSHRLYEIISEAAYSPGE